MTDSAAASVEADLETIDLLKRSADDFCARSLDVGRIRGLRESTAGYDRAVWIEMCELGWAGIVVAEARGGLGLGAHAAGTVCRALGRVVAPEPMIECGIAAAHILSEAPEADSATLLDSVISGETVAGVQLSEADEFAATSADRAS